MTTNNSKGLPPLILTGYLKKLLLLAPWPCKSINLQNPAKNFLNFWYERICVSVLRVIWGKSLTSGQGLIHVIWTWRLVGTCIQDLVYKLRLNALIVASPPYLVILRQFRLEVLMLFLGIFFVYCWCSFFIESFCTMELVLVESADALFGIFLSISGWCSFYWL